MITIPYRTDGILGEMTIEHFNSFGGGNISDQQVLKSAAGYYIGELCIEPDGFYYPYSRDSARYWATREEAEQDFKTGDYPIKF